MKKSVVGDEFGQIPTRKYIFSGVETMGGFLMSRINDNDGYRQRGFRGFTKMCSANMLTGHHRYTVLLTFYGNTPEYDADGFFINVDTAEIVSMSLTS